MATLLDIFNQSDLAALGVNASRLSGRHTHDSVHTGQGREINVLGNSPSGRHTHNTVHTGEGREINIKFGQSSFSSQHEKNHDVFPQLGMRAGSQLINLSRPALGNRAGFGGIESTGLNLSI